MTCEYSAVSVEALLDGLAGPGWSVLPRFFPDALVARLIANCRERLEKGELFAAAIGRGGHQVLRRDIRGDHIHWIDEGQSAVIDHYLSLLSVLRLHLNRELFLGLESFEGHFAQYPAGAFYRRHLDRFQDDDRRAITFMLYLNADWQPGDGGELRIHLADGRHFDVAPRAGTLVAFRSAEIPHEVLPVCRERLSLTGWFLRRGDGVVAIRAR